jgi:hypothetical protein
MKFLPIRPKPLMATLIFASTIAFFCPEFAATAVCAATLRAKSSELLPKVTHELVLLNPEKLEKPLETAT